MTTDGRSAPESRTEESAAPPSRRPTRRPAGTLVRPTFLHNLWSANTVTVTVLAIVLALVIGAILIIVSDPEVLATFTLLHRPARPTRSTPAGPWSATAYADLFKGAVFDPAAVPAWLNGSGTWQAAFTPISETLTYAAPLVFTGLSVALAFRGGLFNIGGAGPGDHGRDLRRAWPASRCRCRSVLHLIVALIAGAVGGAVWGFVPGILKARTGAHEVITTIMLNYIALLFLTWLILQNGVQDPDRTDAISKAGRLLGRSCPGCSAARCGCNLGIVLAVLVTVGRRLAAQPVRRSASSCGRSAPTRPPRGPPGISVGRTYIAGDGRRRRRWPGWAARRRCSAPRERADPRGGRQHRLRRHPGRAARPGQAVGHAAGRAAVRRAAGRRQPDAVVLRHLAGAGHRAAGADRASSSPRRRW